MSSLPVGSDIEALCGKCGDVWHVVAAKVGDKIAKVVCKQCGQQHRYKAPPGKESANAKPKKAGSTARAASGGSKKASTPRESPKDGPQVAVDESKPPRVYKPTETYKPGERLTHPSFGTGVVESVPGPGKIQVFFPVGRKVLALTRVESTLERPVRRGSGEGEGEGGGVGGAGGGLPKGL